MTDHDMPLVLDALERALEAPDGLPLVGRKNAPGLFAATAAGRRAAANACTSGYFRVLRTEPRGKSHRDFCTLTNTGMTLLLDKSNLQAPLTRLAAAIESQERRFASTVDDLKQAQHALTRLKRHATALLNAVTERTAQPSQNGAVGHAPTFSMDAWHAEALTYLRQWPEEHANEDCPLPELYRHARHFAPMLTPGQYHDGLRALYGQGKIYLYPWTGPLYEIPEPGLALLAGHAVAYYAAARE